MPIEVLLVEDSPGDVRLTQEAFREAGKTIRVHVATDGVETTSVSEKDIAHSYQLQANCHLSKPVQLDEFESLVRSICDFWLIKVKLPQQTSN